MIENVYIYTGVVVGLYYTLMTVDYLLMFLDSPEEGGEE